MEAVEQYPPPSRVDGAVDSHGSPAYLGLNHHSMSCITRHTALYQTGKDVSLGGYGRAALVQPVLTGYMYSLFIRIYLCIDILR